MIIILFILLAVLALLIYFFTAFPKNNVLHHAHKEDIPINVWAKAMSLRNKCKSIGTYYPFVVPNFALAHLASAYSYFYNSKANDETVVGAFVVPSDIDMLFNNDSRSNNRYNDPSQPPQKSAHNHIGIVAFLITSHSRLMFAHWEGKTFGASTGMYTLNPNQASCKTRRNFWSTCFNINPNSNSDEDAWGICYFPFANVANNVEHLLNNKIAMLNQKSLKVDDDGRTIM